MGGVAMSVQLVAPRSEFACNVKSMEGTVQEISSCGPASAMLNRGEGTACHAKIPPWDAPATNFVPSAEDATHCHPITGASAWTEVPPALVEV